jgi:hypothetical protein
MIYSCVRAWKECPNLFLWNVGAWSVLAMLASSFAESLLPFPEAMSIGFGLDVPTQPTFTNLVFEASHSEAFQFSRLGFAFCGFLLMLVAVARCISRRVVVAPPNSDG